MAELLSFCQPGVLLKCSQRSWYYLPSINLHVRFLRKCYHCQSVLCNLLVKYFSWQFFLASWLLQLDTVGSSKNRCRFFSYMYFFHKQLTDTDTQQHAHSRGSNSAPAEYWHWEYCLFFFHWWTMNYISFHCTFIVLLKIIYWIFKQENSITYY